MQSLSDLHLVAFLLILTSNHFGPEIEASDFVQNLRRAEVSGVLDHPTCQNFGLRCVEGVGDSKRGKGLIATHPFRAGDLLLKVRTAFHRTNIRSSLILFLFQEEPFALALSSADDMHTIRCHHRHLNICAM